MEQFEYKTDSFRGLIGANKLNPFGKNRWRLIQIVKVRDDLYKYFFIRTIDG
ncbi:MAG: hypothetical protein KAS04_04570 [Candidatus Aenigmarchaeota archaeon]|nr:hypothetical protein [Candidatus Aenigmarchaeota archaeon]